MTKPCKICKVIKEVTAFPKAGTYNGLPSYRGECLECNRIKQKGPDQRAAEKKYKTSEKGRIAKQKRREIPEIREKEREYERSPEGRLSARTRKKKQYHTDPVNNLKVRLRARFAGGLKAKNLEKQISVATLIGCPLPKFKEYIESMFKPGMSWDVPGSFHIDHINPLDSATSEEEMYKLWHYTNLQPLSPTENLKKSNKII